MKWISCLGRCKPMGVLFGLLLIVEVALAVPATFDGKDPNKSVPKTDVVPSPNINYQLLTAPEKAVAIDKDDLSILKRHYPFYFAYGNPSSKLQVSFKTLLIKDVPLYFGYTQLMFWDLLADSKPFRDLTYNPEIFYRWTLNKQWIIKSIDFGGFAHNSNGKAGLDSRSYNKSYVRANFETETKRWVLRFSTEASYLYDFDDTNTDIMDYIGPLSLNVTFVQLYESWIDKTEFSLKASPAGRFADRWDRGGYQASLSFRLGGLKFVPAFYFQYYQGYAETLLNYNKQISVFRGGFLF